ncbi:TetR/AcrR family transcriptional regulator [Streptomyces sp. NPDC049954]|uniref:TetR/AcrR family transcriptional regulator n=1 Tax=Streptomyces sp. NPDC049954 TaxID=3155779 RepID=UPI0034437BF6
MNDSATTSVKEEDAMVAAQVVEGAACSAGAEECDGAGRDGAACGTTGPRRAVRPRADALRNRERIVEAAREMAVEHGADISLDEVARRAGVGNATVYRHFHDRAELMRQSVLSVMDRASRRAEEALEGADPFEALCGFAHAAVEERVGALCSLLSVTVDMDHPDLLAGRLGLEAGVEAVMSRAREAGQLRPDIGVGDLMMALSQLTRPLPGCSRVDSDRFAHRHLQLFLDGLRAPAHSVLPGTAVTLEELRRE